MVITKIEKTLLEKEVFVVLSIQTTTFSPDHGGRIIEVGAVRIECGVPTLQFSTFINPRQPIPAKITKLTGISNEVVKDAPEYGKVLPDFYNFIKGAVIVAHAADFKWSNFLMYYFKGVGLHPDNPVLDAKVLFEKVSPHTKHNLATMCDHFEVELEDNRSSMCVAYATAACFLKLKSELLKFEVDEEGEDYVVECEPKTIYPTNNTRVTGVRYWEKQMAKDNTHRRMYVTLFEGRIFGTVYLDLDSLAWYNKDFPYQLNFRNVARMVMVFTGIRNTDEFKMYIENLKNSGGKKDAI